MKTITALGLSALLTVGIAGQASAFSFSPKNTHFTASGPTSLTKGTLTVPCTANFTGSTDATGLGKVLTASFTGSSICTGIKATGLPWPAKATSATTALISHVAVTASIFGTCGPSNVPTTVSKTGVITFSNVTLTPNCKVKGSITTHPAVTIVSP